MRNNLFYTFRELGRVLRIQYLLEYVQDIEMRKTVNAVTYKSEELNNFLQWVFFYNNGIIQENLRQEQIKLAKYNHSVANLIILHNVNAITKGIAKPEPLAEFPSFVKLTGQIKNTICVFVPTSLVNLVSVFFPIKLKTSVHWRPICTFTHSFWLSVIAFPLTDLWL
ncbi:MAG: hypothetical protein ACI9UN_002363 [Granulosicoccus sp.]|jgi:hypothetical protein